MSMTQKMESVLAITNGTLYAVVWLDMKTRKNVFFKCEEMSMSDVEDLLKAHSQGETYESKKNPTGTDKA